MRNVEIKAKLPADVLARVLQVIEQWKTVDNVTLPTPRIVESTQYLHQVDTFFQVPEGRLKLRQETARGEPETSTLIAYKRANQQGPKLSVFKLAPVIEPALFIETLSLILPVLGKVEKHRTVHIVYPPTPTSICTRVHLDTLLPPHPDSGVTFLELEVLLDDEHTVEQGQSVASSILEQFGVTQEHLATGAYLDLSTASASGR